MHCQLSRPNPALVDFGHKPSRLARASTLLISRFIMGLGDKLEEQNFVYASTSDNRQA